MCVQIEAPKPLRGGGGCGDKSFRCGKSSRAYRPGGKEDVRQFAERESLYVEGSGGDSLSSSTFHTSHFTVADGAAAGWQRRHSSFSMTVDRCPPCTCIPPSPRTRHTYFGTEILYSSKGVANTAILKSSSAAFGLIPPSRSFSILNHLSIPTLTVC